MKCNRNAARRAAGGPPAGFTLVELLVVVTIIGILAAILVPTVYLAMNRARHTRIAVELSALHNAIENYKQKHGDYPPDFSNKAVVRRHIQKTFPNIAPDELNTVWQIFWVNPNDDNNHQSRVDPAEALVFWLGGLSSNPRRPFTGPGGPLIVQGNNVFYNPDRGNSLFDFDERRLTLAPAGGGILSNDEDLLFGDDSGNDPFPVYLAQGRAEPYVYFDSRTYGGGNNIPRPAYPNTDAYFSAAADMGRARPYQSSVTGQNWANRRTFQIISAGLDGDYGADNVDKFFPSGQGYGPGDLDNITNFSDGRTLEDSEP